VVDGEFDYDETVDLILHREGEEAPLAINRVSLAQAVQEVVDQWTPSQPGSVLIIRDGPDITSFECPDYLQSRGLPACSERPSRTGCRSIELLRLKRM